MCLDSRYAQTLRFKGENLTVPCVPGDFMKSMKTVYHGRKVSSEKGVVWRCRFDHRGGIHHFHP